MSIQFGEAIAVAGKTLTFHEMELNMRVLERYIEGNVEEKAVFRALSEIEEHAANRLIAINCLRFHEAVTQMQAKDLSVKEAKQWMICAISAMRAAHDSCR